MSGFLFQRNQEDPASVSWIKISAAILAFVLLNSIFQYVALRFGYKRYFLNAELLVAALAVSLRFRWIGVLIFLAATSLEILLGLTDVFHFMDVREAMDMMEFTFLARPDDLFRFGAALAVAVVCFLLFSRLVGGIRSRPVALLLLLLGVGLTYCQWAVSEESGKFFTPVHANRDELVFGSSFYFLKNTLDMNTVTQAVNGNPDIEYRPVQHPSAAKVALGDAPSAERILFIVGEAWGLPKDTAVLQQQISKLRKSPHVQDFSLSDVYARGATAAGELRELCGLIPSRMNFGKMTTESVGQCLPSKLKSQGFATVAVHGAESAMYRRSRWYPVLGFDELIFREDMPPVASECYSFPGYCDRNIFPVVHAKLRQGRAFVYWLTLNSHVPYDRRDVVTYREDICKEVFGAQYPEMLCNYQNLHTQFFDGLARLIEDEEMKGVQIVVVGDHAPIFLDDETRGRFDRERVPTLSFTVK
jgi:Sulfatase